MAIRTSFGAPVFAGAVRSYLLGALCVALTASPILAASKAEKARRSEQLVQEALHREIYGLSQERDQLLEQALEQTPDYAPAMWHRGYVRYQNKWIKAEDLPQKQGQDPRLIAYNKIRGRHGNTVEDQMELANWCRKRSLNDQQRAHLTQVITLDPNHAEARNRLGFRRVDGVWMNTEEINREADQLRSDRQSLAKWGSKIEALREGLGRRSAHKRKIARERILEISDPDAVGALESVLSNHNEAAAQLAVETISNISDNKASVALARQAVLSPWESVRQTAAENLRTRSKDSYVPPLLSVMHTPVVSVRELTPGRNGRLIYRHSFLREGQDQHELLVMETEYRRISQQGGDREESLARAELDASLLAATREMQVNRQNHRSKELNERVSWVLETATEQSYSANPQLWWNWWNQHNEVFIQGNKQVRTLRQQDQVVIVDRANFSSGGGQMRMDCLVAGTPVWTAAGSVAIEALQIGDLVLSQDPETGELAYKPVLRTTLRPKSRLIVISTEDDTIRASGGHPFWVAGEGWVKARDLKPGMQLHSVGGSANIRSVEEGSSEPTHNLVVADFNTYFVGSSKILNHDNTIRQPVGTVVPGLDVQ